MTTKIRAWVGFNDGAIATGVATLADFQAFCQNLRKDGWVVTYLPQAKTF